MRDREQTGTVSIGRDALGDIEANLQQDRAQLKTRRFAGDRPSLSFRVSGRKELLWFFALYADRQAEQ